MTWTTNDFRTYAARFPRILREAAARSPEAVPFGAFANRSEAEAEAVLFRKYRFLVRSSPGVDFALSDLIARFNYRAKVIAGPLGIYELAVIAKPTPVSELLALNPELRDIITAECQ